MGFANKMAPSVAELSITSGFRKKELKPIKIPFLVSFKKIVELNTDVLEPSLLSQIDNWSLLFKMNPKPN